MANKTLFQSLKGTLIPQTNAVNHEYAPAYAFSAEHTLAQYAITGCLNHTFYASGDAQLKTVLSLCEKLDPEYIAKVAIYTREKGFMKDMPALLCAILSRKSPCDPEESFSASDR
ncbi:hypothetical protein L0222_31150 [bacterium]|nr:hypothetical protein [bacterium]